MHAEKPYTQKESKRIQILLIGDSISEGYTPFVKNFFKNIADVHRPNENCGSTKLGLEKLEAWLGENRWDVIHFNWGLHDLRYVDENGAFAVIPRGTHFVPLPDYRENLRLLVGRLKQTGAQLIWCASTPVPKGCSWRVENDEMRFNAVAARVMRDENIPVNDLHEAVRLRLGEFQEANDVHFNAVGSAFMGKAVFEAIQRVIPRAHDRASDFQLIRDRCSLILHEAFRDEKGWIKIHAAEALLGLDKSHVVSGGLASNTEPWEGSSQIGLWRVKAACSKGSAEKHLWIGHIEQWYVSETGPLALNALESLCKLGFVATGETLEKIRRDSTDLSRPEAPFALWALQLAGSQQAVTQIGELLSAADPEMRKLSAFVLRWMRCTDPTVLRILAECADKEPRRSEAYPFVLGAGISLKAKAERVAAWKSELVAVLEKGNCIARYEVCQALKNDFTQHNLDILVLLLNEPEADVRIGAATAILALIKKSPESLQQDPE